MSLNVTVTPGHTFTDNETVTTGKLNAAAEPTVAVSGSIDASELGASSVGTTQLANASVTATKMGVASDSLQSSAPTGFTMSPAAHGDNKKGVILASGAIDGGTVGQFDELWAGSPNSLLIGHATKTDGTWTGDWSVRSKALSGSSSIFVDQQDANTITMLIKNDSINRDMMKSQSVGNTQLANYSVTIDKIVPGAGTASATTHGIAETDSTFWGGIIDFDPADSSNTTEYNGTAKVLQPSGKGQLLYGAAEGARLKFDYHPCVPRAWCYVIQSGGSYHDDGAITGGVASEHFTILAGHGIESVSLTATLGQYTIRFSNGFASENDSIKAVGFGHRDYATTVFPVAGTSGSANSDTVDANLDVTVTFFSVTGSGNTGSFLSAAHQPRIFTLYFY
tara:strand:+ start:1242 stop:2423 length:1182 start_codon:yes stop_codon:yes gene_type:complete